MPEHFEVILRSITSFGLLLIGTRILGKQTIAKMTMFDFVAAITLGAISACPSERDGHGIAHEVMAH